MMRKYMKILRHNCILINSLGDHAIIRYRFYYNFANANCQEKMRFFEVK